MVCVHRLLLIISDKIQSSTDLFGGFFAKPPLGNGHGVLLVPTNRPELPTAVTPKDATLIPTAVEILFLLIST